MKKTILVIILLQICFIIKPFVAKCDNVLLEPKWKGKTNHDIAISPLHEEAFILAYKISEQEENNKRIFRAYILMRVIYKQNKLDQRYNNNEIQSDELKQLLKDLYSKIENPQTAKDFFYKGLFNYAFYPYSEYDEKVLSEIFNYIIENYQDTIYAKYSNEFYIRFGINKLYYHDEQPIKLGIILKGNPYEEVNLIHNDWYNYLEISVIPFRHLYYIDENYNRIELNGYLGLHEKEKEEKRKITYKVLEGKDLENGKLRPNEEKYARIEVINEDNAPFKGNYTYEFCVNLILEKRKKRGGCHTCDVIIPRTPHRKMDWYERKAKASEKEKKYSLAIENYKEVLKILKGPNIKRRHKSPYRESILNYKISNFYEKIKDYKNAKKYAMETFKYVDEKVKKLEEQRKEKYEDYLKEKKEFISYEEFSKKEKSEWESPIDGHPPLERSKERIEELQKKIKELDKLIAKEEKEPKDKK
jgi:hypothetical protein